MGRPKKDVQRKNLPLGDRNRDEANSAKPSIKQFDSLEGGKTMKLSRR